MRWEQGKSLNHGKYTVERLLNDTGRFSLIYLAKDSNNHKYAIKIPKKGLDKRKIDQLFKEAEILAGLSHPNIVKVYLSFREEERGNWGWPIGNFLCLPMEYIEGKTLEHLPKPLEEKNALLYIEKIGKALIFIHNKGLLHRDVKPDNIILDEINQEPILVDFELTKEYHLLSSTNTTSTGYSPLEIYENSLPIGPYSDVYSLAATLYFLLTGEQPPDLIQRLGTNFLQNPQIYNEKISDRVSQAILKGMSIEPNQRPQTMQLWLEELLNKEIQNTLEDDPEPTTFSIFENLLIQLKNILKLFAPNTSLSILQYRQAWVLGIGTIIATILAAFIAKNPPKPLDTSSENNQPKIQNPINDTSKPKP